MISLNGVTLSDDLLWVDEFGHAEVSQNIQRTVLGNIIVSSFPKQAGEIIQLKASKSGNTYSGFFTRTQVQAFKALELAVSPVTLSYEGTNYTVIIQSGGVQVEPLIARPNQASGDLYTGILILVTV